ncbi:MAG: outer membrane protein assembly factor BamB [Burkholderiales bacterium]
MLAIILSQLAGCGGFDGIKESVSSGFGLFSGSAAVKPSPLPDITPKVSLKLMWQAHIGAAGEFAFSPAIDGDSVFVGGKDGHIARLDAANGHQKWNVDTHSTLSGGVGAGQGLVVVGTANGHVLAYDQKNGALLWNARVSSEVLSAPHLAGDRVIVRSADSHIVALDVQDGKAVWTYQRETPALTLRSYAGLLAVRGAVFSGFAGGKLAALDATTGLVGWEASVALPHGTSELERIADITSDPVADSRYVYAVAYQGRVACVDAQSGNLVWARDMSSYAGLNQDEKNLYVSDASGAVVALDKSGGASMWKQDKLLGRQLTAPDIGGGYVVVGDFQGYVHLLSREDGSLAGRFATDGTSIRVRPISLDGGLLIQTSGGGLYAIAIQ